MKIVKKLLKVLFWLVIAVVALVLALPLWIGPVARTAANAIVPKKTCTAFNLGQFELNPYTGRLAVGGVLLGNPEGFSQPTALTLDELTVSVDMASVASDTIVIREIALRGACATICMNGKRENNFSVIGCNAKGGEPAKAAGKEADAKPQVTDAKKPEAPKAAAKKSSKKVIIDHLLIDGVKVKVGPVPVALPKIERSGIGRDTAGIDWDTAWAEISAMVLQNIGKIGINLKDFGVNVADLANALQEAGVKNSKQVLDAIQNVKAEDLKNLANTVKDIKVRQRAKDATDSVTKGAGAAVDAAGAGAKAAVDAVGEKSDKAVEAIKGLFK